MPKPGPIVYEDGEEGFTLAPVPTVSGALRQGRNLGGGRARMSLTRFR
jgi:hypothetical protein